MISCKLCLYAMPVMDFHQVCKFIIFYLNLSYAYSCSYVIPVNMPVCIHMIMHVLDSLPSPFPFSFYEVRLPSSLTILRRIMQTNNVGTMGKSLGNCYNVYFGLNCDNWKLGIN